MILLLLKLILAHLIGDFFLQPQKWVKDKEEKKIKSIWLYMHVLLHLVLMFLIVWDLSYTLLIVCIGLLHFIIDAIKISFQTKKTKRVLFFVDQFMHFVSIIIATYLFVDTFFYKNFVVSFSLNTKQFLLIICLVVLTSPTSIIMKTVFSKWKISKLTKDNESLKDAGKYIGILERLLVFIFIIARHWEAVGFLITAKSVFRFGDLTASKERKLTEYILIGTLISFGIAIVVGLIYVNVV